MYVCNKSAYRARSIHLVNPHTHLRFMSYLLTITEVRLPQDVVAPRSILDLSEKLLLTSGIYLPGKFETRRAAENKTTLHNLR